MNGRTHIEEGTATIRPLLREDLSGLKTVIEAVSLFPPEMLDDMTAEYLAGGRGEIWTTDIAERPVGVAYCAPERLTVGTWNLYLIAVHPDWQGKGRGAAIIRYVEDTVAEAGGRMLLVETSGAPDFERTRAFYRKLGYQQEARIRDFYQAGEDKIVFRKVLGLTL